MTRPRWFCRHHPAPPIPLANINMYIAAMGRPPDLVAYTCSRCGKQLEGPMVTL